MSACIRYIFLCANAIQGESSQKQSEIFKLKIDHFEELFDWISLKDLIALGRTCKRMQRIVGYYLRTNYPAIYLECGRYGIYWVNSKIRINGLASYMKKFQFSFLDGFAVAPDSSPWEITRDRVPYMKPNRFNWLNEILLRRVKLTTNGIARIKPILHRVEILKLKFSYFRDQRKEFYENFLQFCSNLKHLCIKSIEDNIVGIDDKWLLRKYPMLEHFELVSNHAKPIIELETFFNQNLNIKHFALNVELLLANLTTIKNIQHKFNVMSIFFGICENKFALARDALNDLYEMGRFMELHVYYRALCSPFDKSSVVQLMSYQGLTKLHTNHSNNSVDLSPLNTLQELCYFGRRSLITNVQVLAKSLINLEIIHFLNAELSDIMPFIQYSLKLKKIIIYNLKVNENVLDVNILDNERKTLITARKITIYVERDIYLATKRTKTGTKLNFIEVKCGASLNIRHDFDYKDNLYQDEEFYH